MINLGLYLLEAYLTLSVLGIVVLNNNVVLLWRKQDYEIPFNATMKSDKKIGAYWIARNAEPNGKTAILLHGWSENSSQMVSRAIPYWNLGYDLYFLDGPGHGKSGFAFFPNGVVYSERLLQLIKKERIEKPVVHGLSFGATAAAILATRHPDIIDTLVLESAPAQLTGVFADFLRFAGIPPIFFFLTIGISELIFRLRYLGEFPQKYDLTNLKPNTFILHGEKDTMFTVERHFQKIQAQEKKNDTRILELWLVDNRGHSDISSHPEFEKRITMFLTMLNT
ncbi:MAG: alpha/beta hydrolase [Methanobacteriota archaeon]|nr:MAG: alpha/beta hydrolase [Euryarchaeota archaeon]